MREGREMEETMFSFGSEQELRTVSERITGERSDLPAFQTRTCAHCGRQTTFALQDRAGWYTCSACGRYA